MKFIRLIVYRLVILDILFFISLSLCAQEINAVEKLIRLERQNLQVIDLALAELREAKLDPSNYRMSIYVSENGSTVVFEDPNISPGRRGSSPNMVSFEVEIDNNMKVISSHYVR